MKKMLSILMAVCMLIVSVPLAALAEDKPVIDTVEIVGATLDIKAGSKPTFTAESAHPELYYIEHEEWDEIGTERYIASIDWYNNFAVSTGKLLDKFVAGKQYVYQIAVQAVDPNCDNNFACAFSEGAALSINGKIYTVDSENIQTEDFGDGVYMISFYQVTTVQPKATTVSASKLNASLSTTSYVYDGKVKKPGVTVKDSDGNKISADNYTLTYASGRKNVGSYSVKITFKGNYSGTKTLYFKINPKSTSISKLTAESNAFTVKWKKQSTQTTGYQIQCATDSKFTKNKITFTVSQASTTSKKIKNLSAKKKYYVRIRTYKALNGKKYYSTWSKAKTVTTKASSSKTVYITPTGKKYHYSKSCAGKNAIKKTLSEVTKSYSPCKKCVS